jgi:hypothetical protein
MDSSWVAAGVYAAAGALGGFIYWGSALVITHLRTLIRAR